MMRLPALSLHWVVSLLILLLGGDGMSRLNVRLFYYTFPTAVRRYVLLQPSRTRFLTELSGR